MLGTETETIAKTDVFIQAKVTTSTPQNILSPSTDDLQPPLWDIGGRRAC